MSHDETSGPVTRKERRAAYGGGRQAAPRYVFSAEAHVREDWLPEDLIERLEDRAKGYNGILRQILCTAASILRQQEVALAGYRAAYQIDEDEVKEVAAEEVWPTVIPPIITKRNQQPGRLSGGEREALKKLVAMITAVGDVDEAKVMAEGRALLTKVRKRALGGEATINCSALMPVGVEEMTDADRSAANKGYGS